MKFKRKKQPGSDNLLVGGKISSPKSDYKVEAVLSRFRYGVVLQCHNMLTNKTVVLKVIKDKKGTALAKHQVAIHRALKASDSKNFNIVALKSAFMFSGMYCLEYKKLDISLEGYMKAKSLPLKKIRPILKQMLQGLSFLRSKGIVHGGLKPDNIMMVDRLRWPLKIQLTDFCSASTESKKAKGSACGGFSYKAPEMLLGMPYNQSVDMWAAGCVAAQMLTGSRHFTGEFIYYYIRCILTTVGMPPDHVLNSGCDTHRYFKKIPASDMSEVWVLKCPHEMRIQDHFPFQIRSLDDLMKVSPEVAEEDGGALECDRRAFVDLLTKMLHVDPTERITPAKALKHPFLTLSHLDHRRHSNYLELSTKLMKIRDMRKEEAASRQTSNDKRPKTKKRSSNSVPILNLKFLVLVTFIFFALFNLDTLVPFLTGSGSYLSFTGNNIIQADSDKSLKLLGLLSNYTNDRLTIYHSKRNHKLMKGASLPNGLQPTLLDRFIDTVWSVTVKMDEIRGKTTDLCEIVLTQIWENKIQSGSILLTTSIAVAFMAILWYSATT